MTYQVLKQIIRSADGESVTCYLPLGTSAPNLGGAAGGAGAMRRMISVYSPATINTSGVITLTDAEAAPLLSIGAIQ